MNGNMIFKGHNSVVYSLCVHKGELFSGSADVVTWIALLGGCRWKNDIERAERAAENALKLDPQNASIYVLLSNIYSVAGRWDDVDKIRSKMREKEIKKIPGQTWIEINGKIHTFMVDDNS